MSAKLYSIGSGTSLSISDGLRQVADAIDSGEYVGPLEAVVVMGGEPDVIAVSGTDPLAVYYLLGRAQRKMERIDLMG